MSYKQVRISIAPAQYETLKDALSKGQAVSLKILLRAGATSTHKVYLTEAQRKSIHAAKKKGKASHVVRLREKQVKYNLKRGDGLLSSILGIGAKVLPFAARALPTLVGGIATGLLSGGIEKLIGGNGLYFRHEGSGMHLIHQEEGTSFLSSGTSNS